MQNVPETTLAEDYQILNWLRNSKVKNLTWSGGEPVLNENLPILLKETFDSGIKNKIVTNSSLLNEQIVKEIAPYIHTFTLSLDSINSTVNGQLGRGIEHKSQVESAINNIRNNAANRKLWINIVASKLNKNCLNDLILYLNCFNLDGIRVFQVSPLRETAMKNYNDLSITDDEFRVIKNKISRISNAKDINFRTQKNLEKGYTIITPDGKLSKSIGGKDIIIKDLLQRGK